MIVEILRSQTDNSINRIVPHIEGGFIETRFVQRLKDTAIIYLSSANGCRLACRYCFLTQTGQTMESYMTVDDYVHQMKNLLEILYKEDSLKDVTILHVNFMARGDPLANPHVIKHFPELIARLEKLATSYHLAPKFKISSIFPKNSFRPYASSFLPHPDVVAWIKEALSLPFDIEFYYSLYSIDPSFRKRWMPNAADPLAIGTLFEGTTDRLRIHHPLIEGQNDRPSDVEDIHDWLATHYISCHYNLVRYNAFDASCGKETPEERRKAYCQEMASSSFITGVHEISPADTTIKAACGMFVEPV